MSTSVDIKVVDIFNASDYGLGSKLRGVIADVITCNIAFYGGSCRVSHIVGSVVELHDDPLRLGRIYLQFCSGTSGDLSKTNPADIHIREYTPFNGSCFNEEERLYYKGRLHQPLYTLAFSVARVVRGRVWRPVGNLALWFLTNPDYYKQVVSLDYAEDLL